MELIFGELSRYHSVEYLKQLDILKCDKESNMGSRKVSENMNNVFASTYFLLVLTWLVHYTLESDAVILQAEGTLTKHTGFFY